MADFDSVSAFATLSPSLVRTGAQSFADSVTESKRFTDAVEYRKPSYFEPGRVIQCRFNPMQYTRVNDPRLTPDGDKRAHE